MKRFVRRLLLCLCRWLELPGEEYLSGRYLGWRGATVFPARNVKLLDISPDVHLHGALFNVWTEIRLHPGVALGHGVCFLTGRHETQDGAVDKDASTAGGIEVGEGAWISSRAIILGGVTIGAGAVVAAGAVVTHDIPPGQTWAGVPARPLTRDTLRGRST